MQFNTNTESIISDNTNLAVIDNNNSKTITYFQVRVKRLTGGEVQRQCSSYEINLKMSLPG